MAEVQRGSKRYSNSKFDAEKENKVEIQETKNNGKFDLLLLHNDANRKLYQAAWDISGCL